MESRKVQRTGDMHYLYLPTSWCQKNNITSRSSVTISQNWNGELVVSPRIMEKRLKELEISINTESLEIINRILVACYINPLKSFRLKMKRGIDPSKLLGHAKLISLESVEFDKAGISGQSGILVADPVSLLKTMLMKIKNALIVMTKNYEGQLINRYEEEIDRSKMLIDKAIVGALTNSYPSKNLKAIDLYYISSISRDLERMVDHLVNLDRSHKRFFQSIVPVIDFLKLIIDNIDSKERGLGYSDAIEFIKKTEEIEEVKVKDVQSYDMRRVKDLTSSISEVLMDWMITKEIE